MTSSKDVVVLKKKRFSNNQSIIGVTKHLYLNDQGADVHFIFKEKGTKEIVPAHRIMLAACSPIFQEMFFGEGKKTGNINITAASVDGFKAFLSLFYLDEIDLNNENIEEFIYLCNKYKVENGLKLCEQFLIENMEIGEVCPNFALAIQFNLQQLREYCEEEIRSNPIDVFRTTRFLDITLGILKKIMNMDNINCMALDVFDACIGWAENICQRSGIDISMKINIRDVLGDCFYLIPFLNMEIQDFSTVVSSQRSLFTFDEIVDIMAFITRNIKTPITEKFIHFNKKAKKTQNL